MLTPVFNGGDVGVGAMLGRYRHVCKKRMKYIRHWSRRTGLALLARANSNLRSHHEAVILGILPASWGDMKAVGSWGQA